MVLLFGIMEPILNNVISDGSFVNEEWVTTLKFFSVALELFYIPTAVLYALVSLIMEVVSF